MAKSHNGEKAFSLPIHRSICIHMIKMRNTPVKVPDQNPSNGAAVFPATMPSIFGAATRTSVAATASILISLCLLMSLVAVCSSQNAPEFQSVSGEFARDWIESFKAENPQPGQENQLGSGDRNNSSLWSWGGAPEGSRIENGRLLKDPDYLQGQLNLSSDWMGDAHIDPDTGLPLVEYLDPFSGTRTYTYLNPDTELPIFTYYSYQDEKTGRTKYSYINALTGKAVISDEPPLDMVNELIGGLADRTISGQSKPWIQL